MPSRYTVCTKTRNRRAVATYLVHWWSRALGGEQSLPPNSECFVICGFIISIVLKDFSSLTEGWVCGQKNCYSLLSVPGQVEDIVNSTLKKMTSSVMPVGRHMHKNSKCFWSSQDTYISANTLLPESGLALLLLLSTGQGSSNNLPEGIRHLKPYFQKWDV